MTADDRLGQETARALAGGDRSRLGTKLPVRERLALLLDDGSFVEDGLLASARATRACPPTRCHRDRHASTGARSAVIAHDPTVKAGSWGRRTVEKQIRLLETRRPRPAAGLLPRRLRRRPAHRPARLPPRPARRGARSSTCRCGSPGRVPQICCLFGPSAAGGAYMPAFCDWVAMVDGNASMYLASPRIAEKAIGEVVDPRGDGRRARCTPRVSGCGDQLCADDAEAIAAARALLLLPARVAGSERPAPGAPAPPAGATGTASSRTASRRPTTSREVDRAGRRRRQLLRDQGALGAGDRRRRSPASTAGAVGIVANQPQVRSGAIQVDSADKAARFISPLRRVQPAAASSSPTSPGS